MTGSLMVKSNFVNVMQAKKILDIHYVFLTFHCVACFYVSKGTFLTYIIFKKKI